MKDHDDRGSENGVLVKPRADRGFTLIEVLVVLVVFGFVALILTEGVRFGVRAWTAQATAVARRADLDATDRILRGLIARAQPGGMLDPSVKFVGGPNALQFVTSLPDGAVGPAAREAEVLLSVDAGHRLTLRWTPHGIVPFGPVRPNQSVLLDGVDGLTLSYWRDPSSTETAGWVPSWNAPKPPGLVRLHIAFTQPGRRWPDIVAAPMRQGA